MIYQFPWLPRFEGSYRFLKDLSPQKNNQQPTTDCYYLPTACRTVRDFSIVLFAGERNELQWQLQLLLPAMAMNSISESPGGIPIWSVPSACCYVHHQRWMNCASYWGRNHPYPTLLLANYRYYHAVLPKKSRSREI